MTHDSMIEVIAAHRDGKEIEILEPGGWELTPMPAWNFFNRQYRIKPTPPEPRELWIHGTGLSARVEHRGPCSECRLFREVSNAENSLHE